MKTYNVEEYWSDVANRMSKRDRNAIIAGDDEPFYEYKRRRFLDLLKEVNYTGKDVLEIGCGPGGNLVELIKLGPRSLSGVDISSAMLSIAKENLPPTIKLSKTNGTELPYTDNEFDIVFSVTVLQHNTDENSLRMLMESMCRVSCHKVFLFERIEPSVRGTALNHGRPIDFYTDIMRSYGFRLVGHKFIDINVSYYMAGITRKLLNTRSRKEGEPLSSFSVAVQRFLLPVTSYLDRTFTSQRDLARIEYVIL